MPRAIAILVFLWVLRLALLLVLQLALPLRDLVLMAALLWAGKSLHLRCLQLHDFVHRLRRGLIHRLLLDCVPALLLRDANDGAGDAWVALARLLDDRAVSRLLSRVLYQLRLIRLPMHLALHVRF